MQILKNKVYCETDSRYRKQSSGYQWGEEREEGQDGV